MPFEDKAAATGDALQAPCCKNWIDLDFASYLKSVVLASPISSFRVHVVRPSFSVGQLNLSPRVTNCLRLLFYSWPSRVALHRLHQSHCESVSAYKSRLCWFTAGLQGYGLVLKCPVLTHKEGGEPKYSPHHHHHHNTHFTRDTRKTHTERFLEEVNELVCAWRKVLSRHEAGLFDFACPQIKSLTLCFYWAVN